MNTRDEAFVIDRHPDPVLNGFTSWPIDSFRAARFNESVRQA
jgi:hypothetical protein